MSQAQVEQAREDTRATSDIFGRKSPHFDSRVAENLRKSSKGERGEKLNPCSDMASLLHHSREAASDERVEICNRVWRHLGPPKL